MKWLHKLFESYLAPVDGVGACCGYPECPANISKERMKELICEVRTSLSDAEFEMRFNRIDADKSGVVEFDEFVIWLAEDEVGVADADEQRPPLDKLAETYGLDMETLADLHD